LEVTSPEKRYPSTTLASREARLLARPVDSGRLAEEAGLGRVWGLIFVLAVVGGCGDSGEYCYVEGSVTYAGQPVTAGLIEFRVYDDVLVLTGPQAETSDALGRTGAGAGAGAGAGVGAGVRAKRSFCLRYYECSDRFLIILIDFEFLVVKIKLHRFASPCSPAPAFCSHFLLHECRMSDISERLMLNISAYQRLLAVYSSIRERVPGTHAARGVLPVFCGRMVQSRRISRWPGEDKIHDRL